MKKTWGKIWQGLVFLLRHRGSAACPLTHTICVTCKPGTGSYIWGGAPSREETRLSPRDYFCFLKFSPFFERRKIYVYSLLGFFLSANISVLKYLAILLSHGKGLQETNESLFIRHFPPDAAFTRVPGQTSLLLLGFPSLSSSYLAWLPLAI